MKRCPRCKAVKPSGDFYKSSQTKDGLKGYCKKCSREYLKDWVKRNPEKKQASRIRDLAVNPDTYKARHLRKKYGLSLEQYDVLVLASGGVCDICGEERNQSLSVDHLHKSGPVVIRGMLCASCNSGLGYFTDSPDKLRKAINYLEKPPSLIIMKNNEPKNKIEVPEGTEGQQPFWPGEAPASKESGTDTTEKTDSRPEGTRKPERTQIPIVR